MICIVLLYPIIFCWTWYIMPYFIQLWCILLARTASFAAIRYVAVLYFQLFITGYSTHVDGVILYLIVMLLPPLSRTYRRKNQAVLILAMLKKETERKVKHQSSMTVRCTDNIMVATVAYLLCYELQSTLLWASVYSTSLPIFFFVMKFFTNSLNEIVLLH